MSTKSTSDEEDPDDDDDDDDDDANNGEDGRLGAVPLPGPEDDFGAAECHRFARERIRKGIRELHKGLSDLLYANKWPCYSTPWLMRTWSAVCNECCLTVGVPFHVDIQFKLLWGREVVESFAPSRRTAWSQPIHATHLWTVKSIALGSNMSWQIRARCNNMTNNRYSLTTNTMQQIPWWSTLLYAAFNFL